MRSTALAEFDAYHKWLGIPPTEQPPHYYRLLGVSLTEDDAEVIAAAADRQMAHIKSFAAGRHAAASLALLNELAKARVTLLNARQKSEYDRRLQRIDLAEAPHGVELGPSLRMSPPPLLRQQEVAEEFSHVHVGDRDFLPRRRRQASFFGPVLAMAGAVVAIAVGVYSFAPPVGTRPDLQPRAPLGPQRQLIPEKPQRKSEFAFNRPSAPEKIEPFPKGQGKRPPPARAPEERDRNLPPKAPAPKKRIIAHAVNVDLKNRRQRYALKDGAPTMLQVVSFSGCALPYAIKPQNGQLDPKNDVTIVINGVREVTAQIGLDTNSEGHSAITIECNVTNDAGDKIPFSLVHMARVCREITKRGEAATAAMEGLSAEKSRLEAWIAAPVLKPLAARGQARARVGELDIQIKEQANVIDALTDELATAEKLRALATQIDEDCVIEISIAE